METPTDTFKETPTYTKRIITASLLILFGLLIVTYIFIGYALVNSLDSQIIESACDLSRSLIVSIGGTIFSYLLKSYAETKEEERVKLYRDEMEFEGYTTRDEEDNR